MSEIHDETPNLRWFDQFPTCKGCGKVSTGILRGVSNESYGHYCFKCAERRLRNSERVREKTSKAAAP